MCVVLLCLLGVGVDFVGELVDVDVLFGVVVL